MNFRLWLLKKLTPKKASNGTLTDEDRALALSVRRNQHMLKQQEKQFEMAEKILALDPNSPQKGDFTEELIKQFLPMIMSKMGGWAVGSNPPFQDYDNSNSSGSNPPPNTSTGITSLSDEEIKNYVNKNPVLKQKAAQCTDEQIKEYVTMYLPQIPKETIEKIIVEVRA